MLKTLRAAVLGFSTACLVACGGGGDSSAGGAAATPGAPPTNVLPVVVDSGPDPTNLNIVNSLFTTITVCTPGSTTACQRIDHVLVDTGSVGLRLVSSVLSGTVQPSPVTESGNTLFECTQFADGYTWGVTATVDVQLGSRTVSNLPVNIIGDSPGGVTAPESCTSGLTAENTVDTFAANGVLGVGVWLQDCGSACAPGSTTISEGGAYYTCPSNTCTPTAVALAQQVANPVAALSSDNNGLVIVLPSVPAAGSAGLSGSLYFGFNTQSNNALGSAQLLTLDGYGDVQTTYNSSVIAQSFLDTGSNAYFFNSSLPVCTVNTDFYCPTSGGSPTTASESAQIQGQNTGVVKSVSFTVSNADSVLNAPIYADPGLAGTATPSGNGAFSNYFDWGLPFFFGRPVYELFENATYGAVQGPANGF